MNPQVRKTVEQTPLVVDLDGTLVHSDTLYESAFRLIRHHPWNVFRLIWWLLAGRARLKAEIAARVATPPDLLPWNRDLVAFLRTERALGRQIVLATASHESVARAVSNHVGCFDAVIGSTESRNLKGRAKRDELVRRFGVRGFDYVGDSRSDIAVWAASRVAHPAGTMRHVPPAALAEGAIPGVGFPAPRPSLRHVLRELRTHQWIKNILVFAPAALNHHISWAIATKLGAAFVAFSLTASGAYVFNDLFDLDADRRHPRKRHRPLAAATISIPVGVALACLASAGGLGIGITLGPSFEIWLLIYAAMTVGYSVFLKNKPVVDVVALAILYTIRIYAGGAAVSVWISPWLVQFSIFLFLSLAFVKRYSELKKLEESDRREELARGYRPADMPLIGQSGTASGYIAALVLVLYVNGKEMEHLYPRPELLWGVCPVFVYWITRVWLVTYRGNMNEDPILFAVGDRVSYFAGLIIVLFIAGALTR